MNEKYRIEITKIVVGEKVEVLLGNFNNLDELVKNIDKFVERMRPIKVDPETEKLVEVDSSVATKEQEKYNIGDLKQELINYLTERVINNKLFNECDVEIIKILFENEKD